jgi:lipoprotein-releasing system permease protein
MYELFVSLRYLKSRRRQGFISLITVISVGGVAVGVMVLIVVLSVMSGFETTLKERLLGINAHLWVLPQRAGQLQDYRDLTSRVETIPRVTNATPFTAHEVMLMAGGRVAGTVVRGIDPDERTRTADFARLFEGRDLKALLHPLVKNADGAAGGGSQSAGRGIVLGEELARSLRVSPGEQVILNSPMGILQPAGILPNVRGFTMTGTFVTGMYEYDAKLALISLDEAQELFDLGEMVHGIEVRVSCPTYAVLR